MKNKEYEPNVIEYFAKTSKLVSGLDYNFKKSDNVIDDGYITLKECEDIPVQMVQATNPDIEKESSKELKKRGVFSYTIFNSTLYVETAIKLKANKRYDHSNSLVLLIDATKCDTWIEENLNYLQSLSEVANFRAVYAFYSFNQPKLIAIKKLIDSREASK